MPQSVTSRRSRVAILAVVAMLASLFVFTAAPAGATDGKADNPPTFSACVEDATANAGFSDTGGSFAKASIDCIAYYGITTGTTATTYSPGQVVTRWQMALFLVRAAGPAGIAVPAPTDQGFTDISGLPQATQDAINQLAALGISKGTSATTFSPNSAVSRYQMALFLARFLDDAVVGPGGTDIANVTPDDTVFTDIGNVSVEAYNAIRDLYELGVTTGATATTFSPFSAVNREQMAAFIARTLHHTNARPAGISLQAQPSSVFSGANVDVAISVRDANFAPVANALVDVFDAALADKANAVKADGTCNTSVVNATYGASVCKIDVADVDTNSNGNITDTVAPGASIVWWAWTGSNGASFNANTVDVSSAEVTVNAAAAAVHVTTSTPANADVGPGDPPACCGGLLHKFGTTVTWTAQVVDASGDPVALSGVKVSFVYDTYKDSTKTGTEVATATTDATGKATFTFMESDPSAATNDSATYDMKQQFDDKGLGVSAEGKLQDDWDIVWDDKASAPHVLTVSAGKAYTAGTSQVATGTLYDQYGLGLSGQTVTFRTDGGGFDALGGTVNRVTGPSGTASQTITVPSGTNDFTTVEVEHAVAATADVDIYWVDEVADGGNSGGAQTVLVWDADADTLVFHDGADFVFAVYDTNDQLTAGTPKTYDAFDKLVAAEPKAGVYTDVTITNYDRDSAGVSQFTLS